MIFEGLSAGLFGYISDYLLWWGLYLSLILHTWCFFSFVSDYKIPQAWIVHRKCTHHALPAGMRCDLHGKLSAFCRCRNRLVW